MTLFRAWVQAARPLAQVNIALPLLYGQALAFATHGTFRWKLFLCVHLFGLLDHLVIVFANDAADWQSDVRNATFNRFSGGSRVVPEGKLTPFALAQAALVTALAMGTLSAYLVFYEGRAFMVVIAAIALHLLWMYSFPPFRLSYRGHGEILQGLGLGVLLPVAGHYVQANTLDGLSIAGLLPAFLLGYAGNVVTALPDTPSDRATGKRSFPVRRGERAARRTAVALVIAAGVATPLAVPGSSKLGWAFTLILLLGVLAPSFRRLSSADSDHHEECERFVLWTGGAIQAALLAWTLALFVGRI